MPIDKLVMGLGNSLKYANSTSHTSVMLNFYSLVTIHSESGRGRGRDTSEIVYLMTVETLLLEANTTLKRSRKSIKTDPESTYWDHTEINLPTSVAYRSMTEGCQYRKSYQAAVTKH